MAFKLAVTLRILVKIQNYQNTAEIDNYILHIELFAAFCRHFMLFPPKKAEKHAFYKKMA